MTQKVDETRILTEPAALFDFAGISNKATQKEIAMHIAMLGVNSTNAVSLVDDENDEAQGKLRYHASQCTAGIQIIGRILLDYDVLIGFTPAVQILFCVKTSEPFDPKNPPALDSFDKIFETRGLKGFMPLTPGVIINFGQFGGLYGDHDEKEDEEEQCENT